MYEHLKLLNLQNISFTKVDHEEAMVALVYQSKELILKISPKPNDFFREVYFLKLLENVLPVPRILDVIEPRENLHGAILMERLPGKLLSTPLSYELGQALGTIHSQRLHGFGDPVLDLNSDPNDYFTFKFEEGLQECAPILPQDLLKKCHAYFKEHLTLLKSVDGPCVAHRDFRPGNIMVHNGKLSGIIDWAGARASFAEEDFCAAFKSPYIDDFLKGYKNVRPIPDYQRLLPFLQLNKAIATLGFLIKKENTHTPLYSSNLQFLETFFGAL